MALQKFNAVAGFSVNEFTYDINGNVLTQPIGVIDANANVYANSLFVERYANLGNVGNIYIGGGTNNQVLKTDGYGNLYWALDSSPAGGNTTEVQFNDSGSLNGSSLFTFNKTTGLLVVTGNITVNNANLGNLASANYFSGDGGLLSNITSGNITGQVANANLAWQVYNSQQPNITSVGTLSNLSILGTGSISGANLVSANYITGTLTTQAQPNITSVGTLTIANVSGNINSGNASLGNTATANYFVGNGSLLTGVIGNANYAAYAGNVTIASQPNITSVGTLSSLTVSGLITATSTGIKVANIQDSTGTVTIQTRYNTNPGDVGITSNLTVGAGGTGNLTVNGISDLGPVGNVKISGGSANYVLTTNGASGLSWTNPTAGLIAGSNTQVQFNDGGSFGASANFTFNKTSNTLTVDNYVSQSGNITGANLVSANYFTGTIGTLTDLTTTGNVLIGGNLTVNGATEYTNVNNLYVKDPIIEMGGNANGGALSSNDGKDRGTLLHYYTTQPVDAFMGWDNSNGEFALGSNVSVSSEVVTFNTFGNLRVGNITGAGATLTGNLQVTGNITRDSKNIPTYSSATTAPSNPRIGDQWYDQINDITYQYIYDGVSYFWVDISSGYVGANSSAIANTLTLRDSNANIYANYFIGNGLTITGNVSLGSNTNVHITGGTSGQYLQTDGAGNLTWTTVSATGAYISNGTSNVNAGTVNGNITVSIAGTANTVVFTSTGVNVAGYINTGTGNITSGNAALGNLATANYFSGNGSLLTGLNASNLASGTIPSAILGNSTLYVGTTSIALNRTSGAQSLTGITSIDGYANTVSYATQSNITSVGTLNSVTATGTVNFTGASNVSLGPVANVHISGGSSGYVLKTDGAGTLSWGVDSTNPAGSNTQVQFNDGGTSLGASAAFTFNRGTNALSLTGNITTSNASLGNLATANYFSGNGSLLTSIAGGNVTGQVGNSLVAGTVYTNAQPNITSVGTLNSVAITGTANLENTSNVSLGSIANIHISGGSSGYVLKTDGAGTLSWGADSTNPAGSNTQVQFNDGGSSLGASAGFTFNKTANTLTVNGNITTNNANLGNLVTANYIAGVLTTGAQPNITSLGTLTSVTVTGNVTAGNVKTDNLLYANGVAWSFGSTYSNANVATYLPTYTGLLGGTLSTASQPNVTTVGTLNGLTGTGVIDLTSASNVSLGPVGNIHISGGTANYVLSTDGSGTLSWAAPATSPALTMVVDTFTADGSGNTYTLSTTPPSKDFLLVNIDGVSQLGASYSLTANVVTLGGTPVFGAAVEIKTLGGNTGQAQSGITTGKAIAMAIVFGF